MWEPGKTSETYQLSSALSKQILERINLYVDNLVKSEVEISLECSQCESQGGYYKKGGAPHIMYRNFGKFSLFKNTGVPVYK